MSTLTTPGQASGSNARTVRDLVEQLGNVPLDRVRLDPLPGTATERDVIELQARENRLFELIDGTLVEKAMGFRESLIAAFLVRILSEFVDARDLGVVAGPDGPVRLLPGRVRIPDVAFFSWRRLPGRRVPIEPIPDLTPDLAIEVLSPSNTESEMQIKREEYFRAGVRLVWMIDPELRHVLVYHSTERCVRIDSSGSIDGEDVLPGFTVAVSDIFARLAPAE